MTVILHQEQIKKVISLDESLIPIIENAFVSLSEGKATTPPIMRLDIPEFHGEADVQTAYIKGFVISEKIQQICEKSDILITATPSTEPLIKNDWLKKGIHITAMGSDAEHKNELDPMIIKSCDLYVPDKQSQTSVLGELNHAINKSIWRPQTSIIVKPCKF